MKKLCLAISILIIMVGFNVFEYYQTRNIYPNFLNLNTVDLSRHLIARKSEREGSIFLLGGSSVGGSDVPMSSTLADYLNLFQAKYSYLNLGIARGDLSLALKILRLALNYRKPDFVIVGINPGMFTRPKRKLFDLSQGEMIEVYNASPKNIWGMIFSLIPQRQVVLPLLTKLEHYLFYLREKVVGEVYAKDVAGRKGQWVPLLEKNSALWEPLDEMIKLSQRDGVMLLILLEPLMGIDAYFGTEKFKTYQNALEEYLKSKNVNYFNHIHSIPEVPEYFLDAIHLKPKGYQKLARLILKDLEKMRVEK